MLCCHSMVLTRGEGSKSFAAGMLLAARREMIRRLRRAVIARQQVQAFKPVLDSATT